MAGEDEEFEKLLGEIPLVMESSPELDDLESASSSSPLSFSEDAAHIEHKTQSMYGLFQAVQSCPGIACSDAEFYSILSSGNAEKINRFIDLHSVPKILGVKDYNIEAKQIKVPYDAFLDAGLTGSELKLMHSNRNHVHEPHLREVSLDKDLKVSLPWKSFVNSSGSIRKNMSSTAECFTQDPSTGASDMHAYNKAISLEQREALLFGSIRDNESASDVGFMNQVSRDEMLPSLVSVPENGLEKFSLDGKWSWKQTHWQEYTEDPLGARSINHSPAFSIDRDHAYDNPLVGGTVSPGSQPYYEQTYAKYCLNHHCKCTENISYDRRDCNYSYLQSKSGNFPQNKGFQGRSGFFNKNDLLLYSELVHYGEKPHVWALSRKSSRVAAVPLFDSSEGWHRDDLDTSMCKERRGSKQYSTTSEQSSSIKPATQSPKAYPFDAVSWGTSFKTLAEVEGDIVSLARDQHGCRLLQEKFEEGAIEDIQRIFFEILDHVSDLMVDPFGNYLIQKLLEVCTDDQRLELLKSVTTKRGLVSVSLNMHGTRAVQKLIETLKSPDEVNIATSSLKSGVVILIKDLHGNHVIQRCLQHLNNKDNEFIFEAAAQNCVEIATHRHGCCVLQRCIDHSTGVSKQKLIREIASNSLQLSQDPFGNYVVQYVLELGFSWAVREVVNNLVENYACLSMQKSSSNVVEKCLKSSQEEGRACIIQELINSSHFLQLLQHPYANYVIQTALIVSKGHLLVRLAEAIRPHTASIRNNPYGKRILSHKNLKKF
ncbi:hypothetical protein KP509_35G059400 [Ceratopteris richardii]|uniref:PUM-HD domain-containing protein n=1 Tax=Ceratopteris richardii TaxID=49495 RepID=A0A8T2QHG7_CERRI|nr:hypothetical protein KP509_35G059400 [Ceratopteris richardii]KAH7283064.1 hypothetical protein KP509_35G059400 [Ceratopteris richardii]KAH7283065.1 hypothetical protein KP509_35G059400 [Ceratopteris richardii]KAH7283066.1 hypothetical protein KP509_35G059400 [Ceratopteris richardii]KAH7283067.1 hypothetical protein KP509_35G059400 [Ceratopteris richardii]